MVRSPSCFTAVGTNGELLLARTLQSGMKTPKKLRRKELTTSIQSIRVSRRLSVRRDRPNELCKVLKRQLLPNRFHNNLVLNGGLRKNPKEEKMGMTTRSSVSQMEVTSLSDDPIGAKKTPLSCSNGGSTTGSELECRWLGCSYRIDGIDSSLANHILDAHVVQQRGQQGFICLWDGCKVATKPSKRLSWLETHVVEKHCGSRPYVCFLCTLRFASKPSLEKHVDSHFPLPEGQISEISRLNGHSHANGFSSSDELKKRQRRYFLTARDERIITRSQDRTQLIRSPLPPKPWPLPNDAVQTSSKPTEPLTLTIVESSLPIRSQETHVATSKAHVNGEGIKVPLPASSNGFISRRNRRKLKPTSGIRVAIYCYNPFLDYNLHNYRPS